MKRFYRSVDVAAATEGFAIHLDGRPIMTPAKNRLTVPTETLAQEIATEWAGQGEKINTASLALTQLANVAIDRIATARDEVVAAVAVFGESELLCYRAAEPEALVERQRLGWQPLLDWAALRYDAVLEPRVGIMHQPQSPAALRALAVAVAALDDWHLAGLQDAVGLTGSLVLSLALIDGRLTATEAFDLSQLDETFQIEQWGEDYEAADRRSRLARDLAAIARFIGALRR